MARVFISYRRGTSAVLANLIRSSLNAAGVDSFLDTAAPPARGEFPELLRDQIQRADTVIAILDSGWLASTWMQEELRFAHSIGRSVVPVFTQDYEPPSPPLPDYLQNLLSHNGVTVLTRQGIFVDDALAQIAEMVRSAPAAGTHRTSAQDTAADVDLEQLPTPLLSALVGREREREYLRAALDDGDVAIAVLWGFGGTGKTSVVDAFLSDVAPHYGGAGRVFAWHFYSQETQAGNAANATAFWEEALTFFGYDGEPPVHEVERARELARVLSGQQAVLILDGIEPLQSAPHVNHGQLSDKAMRTFLTTIARHGLPHGGLVVITSRQPLVELDRFHQVRTLPLDMLADADGVNLLRRLGIRGSFAELLTAVREHHAHPLSLVLLANLLTDGFDGDVLHRVNVELAETDVEDRIGSILAHYVRGWDDHSPEMILLYLVSLFRRPMREEELDVLLAESTLGRELAGNSANRVRRTVGRLRNLGLVSTAKFSYDTHALIRQYFAVRLREHHPVAHRQAHEILFEHFRAMPSEEHPTSLATMEPLYQSIYHGCMAGRYSDALGVYWQRISREVNFFSQKQLGAFSSDLVALSPFFPDGWATPVRGDLDREQRALLIALAAFLLAGLGRLTDAIRPRYTEIAMFEEIGDLRMAAGDLRNLVQTLLPLGQLDEALRVAHRAVAVAETISGTAAGEYSSGLDERFILVSAFARRGTVLHRAGRLSEAALDFERALDLQGGPLERVNSFYHGLYLASVARTAEERHQLLELGLRNLALASERGSLGDIGYSLLTTAAAREVLGLLDEAQADAQAAITSLTEANRMDRLPAALLQRAGIVRRRWLLSGDDELLGLINSDIAEAEQLIDFSNMALYRVDLNLLRAELLLDQGERDQVAQLLETTIVPEVRNTRYHLRDHEVASLIERCRS